MAAAILLASVALMPAAAAEGEAVDLGGDPVEGSTSSSDPTELKAGVWSDTLDSGESTRYYSYRRTTDLSAVHVGVVATSDQDYDNLEVAGYLDRDETCGSTTNSTDADFPNTTFGTKVSFIGEGPEDRNDPCLTSDVVNFAVHHDGEEAEMPFAITVVEERPTELRSTVDLPSAPTTEPSFTAPDVSGSAEEVTGATSLDDAPELDSGVWKDKITTGDELLYGFDLDWGESVSVRVTTPALDADQAEKVSYSTPEMKVALLNPLRTWVSATPDGAQRTATLSEEDDAVATSEIGPVRYLDRFGDSWAYLPGKHWLSLRMASLGDSQPIEVPVEIKFEIKGEQSGVPTYAGDSDDPFLIDEDTWAETASTSEGGQSLVRIVLAGVLALVGAVCIGAGSMRLRRRT